MYAFKIKSILTVNRRQLRPFTTCSFVFKPTQKGGGSGAVLIGKSWFDAVRVGAVVVHPVMGGAGRTSHNSTCHDLTYPTPVAEASIVCLLTHALPL